VEVKEKIGLTAKILMLAKYAKDTKLKDFYVSKS
jgi:hypothetical protein